jgi:hypothetical protein
MSELDSAKSARDLLGILARHLGADSPPADAEEMLDKVLADLGTIDLGQADSNAIRAFLVGTFRARRDQNTRNLARTSSQARLWISGPILPWIKRLRPDEPLRYLSTDSGFRPTPGERLLVEIREVLLDTNHQPTGLGRCDTLEILPDTAFPKQVSILARVRRDRFGNNQDRLLGGAFWRTSHPLPPGIWRVSPLLETSFREEFVLVSSLELWIAKSTEKLLVWGAGIGDSMRPPYTVKIRLGDQPWQTTRTDEAGNVSIPLPSQGSPDDHRSTTILSHGRHLAIQGDPGLAYTNPPSDLIVLASDAPFFEVGQSATASGKWIRPPSDPGSKRRGEDSLVAHLRAPPRSRGEDLDLGPVPLDAHGQFRLRAPLASHLVPGEWSFEVTSPQRPGLTGSVAVQVRRRGRTIDRPLILEVSADRPLPEANSLGELELRASSSEGIPLADEKLVADWLLSRRPEVWYAFDDSPDTIPDSLHRRIEVTTDSRGAFRLLPPQELLPRRSSVSLRVWRVRSPRDTIRVVLPWNRIHAHPSPRRMALLCEDGEPCTLHLAAGTDGRILADREVTCELRSNRKPSREWKGRTDSQGDWRATLPILGGGLHEATCRVATDTGLVVLEASRSTGLVLGLSRHSETVPSLRPGHPETAFVFGLDSGTLSHFLLRDNEGTLASFDATGSPSDPDTIVRTLDTLPGKLALIMRRDATPHGLANHDHSLVRLPTSLLTLGVPGPSRKILRPGDTLDLQVRLQDGLGRGVKASHLGTLEPSDPELRGFGRSMGEFDWRVASETGNLPQSASPDRSGRFHARSLGLGLLEDGDPGRRPPEPPGLTGRRRRLRESGRQIYTIDPVSPGDPEELQEDRWESNFGATGYTFADPPVLDPTLPEAFAPKPNHYETPSESGRTISFITDSTGFARLRLPLPRAPGFWRLILRGGDASGRRLQSEIPIETRSNLRLELDAPNAISSGDSLRIPVRIANLGDTGRTVFIGLDPTSTPRRPLEPPLEVRVPADTTIEILLTVLGQDAIRGELGVLMTSEEGVLSWSMDIEALPRGRPEGANLAYRVQTNRWGTDTTGFETSYPVGAIRETRSMELWTHGRHAPDLDRQLEHLSRYDTIRAVHVLARLFSSSHPRPEAIPGLLPIGNDIRLGRLRAETARLVRLQQRGGGWKFHPSSPPGADLATTLEILDALSSLDSLDLYRNDRNKIRPRTLVLSHRGWLESIARSPKAALELRIHARSILSRPPFPPGGAPTVLPGTSPANWSSLSDASLAHLLETAAARSDATQVDRLIKALGGRAIPSADGYGYSWSGGAGGTRGSQTLMTTALVIRALAKAGTGQARVYGDPALDWLLNQDRQLIESSALLEVRFVEALASVEARRQDPRPNWTVRIQDPIGGRDTINGSSKGVIGLVSRKRYAAPRIPETPIRMISEGSGRFYATQFRSWRSDTNLPGTPFAAHLRTSWNLSPVRSERPRRGSAGTELHIEVSSPRPLHGVWVEIPVPSVLEWFEDSIRLTTGSTRSKTVSNLWTRQNGSNLRILIDSLPTGTSRIEIPFRSVRTGRSDPTWIRLWEESAPDHTSWHRTPPIPSK